MFGEHFSRSIQDFGRAQPSIDTVNQNVWLVWNPFETFKKLVYHLVRLPPYRLLSIFRMAKLPALIKLILSTLNSKK